MIRSTQSAFVLASILTLSLPAGAGRAGPTEEPGWDEYVAGSPEGFLYRHTLNSGRNFVLAAFGPEGRSVQGYGTPARANAVAAWTGSQQPRWSVRLRPQVDLWYHALAIINVEREELLSRYDPSYAGAIARAKQDRGVGATRLDSLADDFRSEFGSRREFRLLDQLPLYFVDATLEQMLMALSAVADRQTYRRDKVAPEARDGAAIAAQAFSRASLRRVLGRFIEALEQEWQVFYREYWTEVVASDSVGRSELADFWTTTVAPQLEDILADRRLDGGTILVSSAVGPEGRFFIGDPRWAEDNQVVVSSPPGSGPLEPTYHAVKEICYGIVAPALQDLVDDKVETISLRMVAAVRCGAMVLDRYVPILAAGYRSTMMRAVGADTATATIGRFEERFALEPEILAALRNEIDLR
ncbi:MAG: hypothetical protein JSW71_01320 [Gemmatimonadota bacterium]|nr:MAG: hypothetical protein JSW71_01320 [Gemmatimonadota bacterium]